MSKYTDEQIKKALECCASNGAMVCNISECPLFGTKCDVILAKESLDLINRQESEIERLKKRVEGQKHALFEQQSYTVELQSEIANAKSEAIKEFAEKVVERIEKARQKYQRLCKEQGEKEDEVMNIHFIGIINIVRKMVGEGE